MKRKILEPAQKISAAKKRAIKKAVALVMARRKHEASANKTQKGKTCA